MSLISHDNNVTSNFFVTTLLYIHFTMYSNPLEYLYVGEASKHVGPARSLARVSVSLALVLDAEPWQRFHLIEEFVFFRFIEKSFVNDHI
jgi:hypothetical protein